MKRAAFRKLVQPLIRSGHLVQDYRGGFKTVRKDRTRRIMGSQARVFA